MHKRKVERLVTKYGSLWPAPDVSIALGEMTAQWSFLESLLIDIYIQLSSASNEEAFAVLYAVNGSNAKIEIVRALAMRLPASGKKRKNAIAALDIMRSLCTRRNALTHHLWAADYFTGKAYTFDYRAPPGSQARRTRRTAKSIYAFCNEIIDAYTPMRIAAGVPAMKPEVVAELKARPPIKRAPKQAKKITP